MIRKIKSLFLGLAGRKSTIKGNLECSTRMKHFSDAGVGQCQGNLLQYFCSFSFTSLCLENATSFCPYSCKISYIHFVLRANTSAGSPLLMIGSS